MRIAPPRWSSDDAIAGLEERGDLVAPSWKRGESGFDSELGEGWWKGFSCSWIFDEQGERNSLEKVYVPIETDSLPQSSWN